MAIALPLKALRVLRILEHLAVVALAAGSLLRLLPRKPAGRSRAAELKAQAAQYLEAIRQLTLNVASQSVFSWPEVQAAPPASMDVSMLQPGQVVTWARASWRIKHSCTDEHAMLRVTAQSTSFHDDRGDIYRFKIAEGVLVNMYFSRAGVRRSGDLHDCTQYDIVMKGRTRLRMLDPETGMEIVSEYAQNDLIVIPARTPHMFEFLEDNCLLEWWSEDFKAWYYRPYRTIIDQGLPLADTQDRDFSVSVKPPHR